MRRDLCRARALAIVTGALAVAAAGCGGTSNDAIRVGVLSGCSGPFSPFYETTLAGAELPFLRRGARLKGNRPSDGITAASAHGKRVELVVGCQGTTFGTTIAAARRLVERDHVQAVVGPLAVPYGAALRAYARHRPDVVFSIALSGEQGTTLRQPAPNVFRFTLDDSQWMAGLGAYAYRELGWRTAATIGEDDPFGWTEVAGFVAEFCALGGKVVKRIWSPFFSSDLSRLVGQIPRDVDGVLLGDGSQAGDSFFSAYRRLHRDLASDVVTGVFVLSQSRLDDLAGVVAATPFPPARDAPAWKRYVRDFKRWFPGTLGSTGFDLTYYDATEPVLEALERVRGNLSDGEQGFRSALRRVRLDLPTGPVRLDGNRQAIGSNYLVRVVRPEGGSSRLATFRRVPAVDETFGGYFGPKTPEPSETNPPCVKRTPPPWAR